METRRIEFNIDGLQPVSNAEIEYAGRALAELVVQFCGGRTRFDLLTADQSVIPIRD